MTTRRQEQLHAERIEQFRKALMAAHANDWTMEVISEAARVCANAEASHHAELQVVADPAAAKLNVTAYQETP